MCQQYFRLTIMPNFWNQFGTKFFDVDTETLKKLASFKTWMSHSLSTVKSAMEKSWKSWWHRPPPRPLWEARKHCTVASDDKVLTLFPGSARWWFFTCQPAILSWDLGTLTPNPGRSRDPECWLSACLNEPQTCRAFRRQSGRPCADDKTGDHYNDNDNWLFRCKSWRPCVDDKTGDYDKNNDNDSDNWWYRRQSEQPHATRPLERPKHFICDQSHAFVRGSVAVQWFFVKEITNRNTKINIGRNDNNDDKTESISSWREKMKELTSANWTRCLLDLWLFISRFIWFLILVLGHGLSDPFVWDGWMFEI